MAPRAAAAAGRRGRGATQVVGAPRSGGSVRSVHSVGSNSGNGNIDIDDGNDCDDYDRADARGGGGRCYALKRINCSDAEVARNCRREAGVHRSLPRGHPNLLELLGLKFATTTADGNNDRGGGGGVGVDVCYMLFPYVPRTLRGEITDRNLLQHDGRAVGIGGGRGGSNRVEVTRRRRPFATSEVLRLFGGIVDALAAIHGAAKLSHRDVKLENVLLRRGSDGGLYGDGRHGGDARTREATGYTPVLMDYGSAGPLVVPIGTRGEVRAATEEAASNTTMPYRPPELFEGGCRHGAGESLDYGRVDVW